MQFYKFAEFTLNPTNRRLSRNGQEIEMRDRDFDVLMFLLENRPQIVSKDEIIKSVWNGLIVEDNSVERAVVNIRKILDDSASNPQFIKTIRGRGYLFISEIENIKSEKTEDFQIIAPNQTVKTARRFLLISAILILLAVLPLIWLNSENLYKQTIFYDDFAGKEIDSEKWIVKGNSVRIFEGIAKISVDEVDKGGKLQSAFFTIDPNKPLTIKSKVKISYNQSVQSNVNFIANFGFIVPNNEANFYGIKYANAEGEFCYQGNIIKTEGFYLIKNDGDVRQNRHHVEGKIGPQFEPLWDKWFDQKLIYLPENETLLYFIDGEKKGEFVIGKLFLEQENKLQLVIYPQGWWLHHFIEIDEIEITQ